VKGVYWFISQKQSCYDISLKVEDSWGTFAFGQCNIDGIPSFLFSKHIHCLNYVASPMNTISYYLWLLGDERTAMTASVIDNPFDNNFLTFALKSSKRFRSLS
jgi:hypothetical protein